MNGASVAVNGALGENGCETEPIWERPWTLEEIHKASGNWSLGADAGLLLFLQDFSQRMLSRTHEIEKQLDGLIQHTKATDSRLHNVFNDFLMLSNIQFIENRVYDEEVEEAVKPDSGGKPAEVERTREQKEAELIAKVQEAVRHGLRVLDSAFEQLDIKAGNSDSEDEETTERAEHLLEPKDLYVDRPLPYIIGSPQFMEEEDVGLGDLSSEESVDSERGSIVESEEEVREKEEESEDDFDESEEDEEKLPKSVPKQQLVSDEEDDDSDLFHESEKENDEGVLASSKKMGHISFAEELAARIQEGSPEKPDEEKASLTSHGSTAKGQKSKKETRKAKQQEESNLFGSENADEDDIYSPFCSKGGLFSGGKGLFDDDEGDLFTEAPKEKIDEEREVKPAVEDPAIRKCEKKLPTGAVSIFPAAKVPITLTDLELQRPDMDERFSSLKNINEAEAFLQPSGGGDVFNSDVIPEKTHGKEAKKKVTNPPPAQSAGGLFDEEDDDLFGPKTSGSAAVEPKPAPSLFDDSDDSGLFETSVTPKVPKEKSRAQQNAEPVSEVLESLTLLAEKSQTSSGLFSDEDESKDLFFPNKESKRNESKQSSGSKTKPHQLPISLFDDDEGDLFGAISSKDSSTLKKSQQQNESKVTPSSLKSTALFDSDECDWQSSKLPVAERAVDSEDTQTSMRKEVTPKAATASKAVKKTSLFDDPEEDYLFGVSGKESQKKSQKVSLLFEDDDEDDLFASKPAPSKPAAQKPAAAPQGSTVFTKAVENDAVESDGKSQMEQKVEREKTPPGTVPLFGGIDVLEQQGKTKLLTSNGVTSQEDDARSKPSTPASQEELQSNRKAVVSLFDDEEDEHLEDTVKQCNLVHDEKLPESGTSTRVFQDEELLFSHHQQKDNDPDVDLFADAWKPEVKKTEVKSPINPPLSPPTKAVELPSHDLFDTTDNLFSSTKPSSTKAPSSKSNIFDDKEDDDLFTGVSKKPTVEHTRQTNTGPIKTKGPSSRIGKLQANLAINPASLLPGTPPKFQGIVPGSTSLASSLAASQDTATASESAVGEGSSVSFNQPAQVDTLHNVNKGRAKVARKRRPPTREARRLAAQQSAEVEEVDQQSETDSASVKNSVSQKGLVEKPTPNKTPSAVLTSPIEISPDKDADPLSVASVNLHSDLFSSGDSFKSSLVQGPPTANGIRTDSLPKKDPVQSIFAPSDDYLFRSSKQTMKKPKPAAFLEEENGEDLFGTAKLETTKPSTKTSKSVDIFEDDLFATESVTLTKKKTEGSMDVNLFDDNVDIFADIKIAPKEKKSRKKIETKSIFDDDMDDIFAPASSSASAKKQFKPKTKSNQAAIPTSTPDGKAANIFDDPLNVFGP